MIDPASFRDPSGHVIMKEGRVFRVITPAGLKDFQAFSSHPLWDELQEKGKMQQARILTSEERQQLQLGQHVAAAIEHKMLPFISYPYEWPYEALRTAALHHLDLHLELLDSGFTLKDASAYNIQFDGAVPVFIDTLSIIPYREGAYWLAHDQFIRHFLCPLLLGAYSEITPQLWLRSSLEGIDPATIVQLLPLRTRLNYRLWLHLFLPVKYSVTGKVDVEKVISRQRPLPKRTLQMMLKQLKHLIKELPSPKRTQTAWSDYATKNSYSQDTEEAKSQAVHRFVMDTAPSTVIDIGCNDGHYSRVALDAGAKRVLGLDIDHAALDRGFLKAQKNGQKLTYLLQDMANPSPSQGWLNKERSSVFTRLKADCVVALAVIHHLAIGRNIALVDVAKLLLSLSPECLVEFVPKDDPMVTLMLSQREDIFHDYGIEQFIQAVTRAGGVLVSSQQLVKSNRSLLHIRRI